MYQMRERNGSWNASEAILCGKSPSFRCCEKHRRIRQTHDRVTALGSGVDGAVRRISTTYEVRGMREKISSYNGETVGSGSVVNEVLFTYNNFGQLTADYQDYSGAVTP